MLYQSGIELVAGSNAALDIWVVELLSAASAVLLIVGLLTPCAAAVLGVLEIATHSFLSPTIRNLADGTSATALTAATAAAIMLLGPGALSVDARLFGLREIIIPAAHVEGALDQRS